MTPVTITFDKAQMLKTVESLLWKYGKTIEGAENYKQVYNTQAADSNNVDARVLSDSFLVRTREAIDMLREFVASAISYDTDGDPSVSLSMPTRWIGNQETLQKRLNKYVEDGIMADWLNVTAPSEASVYATQLPNDETNIRVELYAKRRP